jgi:hypothetical protein
MGRRYVHGGIPGYPGNRTTSRDQAKDDVGTAGLQIFCYQRVPGTYSV